MDDIILAAYDVAVGSARWPQLARALAEALDSKNLLIFLIDVRTGVADLLASTGAKAQDRIEPYLTVARRMATRSGDSSHPMELGQTRRLAAVASDKVARWNSLNDGDADYYLAGRAIAEAGEAVWLCIGLDIGSAMAAVEVHETVERVHPHFCRAAEIDLSLRAAVQRSRLSEAVFDRLPFGLLQFDRNATVLYANAEAERISRAREGFVIAAHKVRARSSADDAALQSAIREATVTGEPAFARWLNLKRGKGRRPYRLLVTTVPDARDVAASASGCVLFITDPDRPSMFDPDAVADAFGLTAAEARVVARLAVGSSLPDIASSLNVSINTVRTLLARAMGKTATNTQVALVRLVLTTTFGLTG
ncbi:MAG: PAS domain-containing protein [Enhydrobacter sp.]|nr:PAS domain-containing protein [Enhydrobacter sp.]